MHITRTNPYPSLPMALEPSRARAAADNTPLLLQPPGAESRQATRAIEDIRSAEQILSSRRQQNPYENLAQEGRQQKALAAYQSLQRSDERAYVSEVLGIDVYA
ncbi:MAG: hypothetical protein P8166_17245 [Candidatus Thiodiazotropha sp.]|jgi:hypothetical protein